MPLATVDLGDDVLEVGPGYGATTDVFRERVGSLTSVEIDPVLADELWCRGRAALQVLAGASGMPAARPGAPLASPGLVGDVAYDDAPFGVGYLVADWAVR